MLRNQAPVIMVLYMLRNQAGD